MATLALRPIVMYILASKETSISSLNFTQFSHKTAIESFLPDRNFHTTSIATQPSKNPVKFKSEIVHIKIFKL